MRKTSILGVVLLLAIALTLPLTAQGRPKSPRVEASTQVGSGYNSWVVVDYGAPILRGRQGILGSGDAYGKTVYAGAPVWRAGANPSTRLKSDVALKFGDVTVPAGEHSLFIELKSPTEWNLIISNHAAQQRFDRNDTSGAIWGAYGYDSASDVGRTPMTVADPGMSIDQLVWWFTGVSETGGTLNIGWDNAMAAVAFTVAE